VNAAPAQFLPESKFIFYIRVKKFDAEESPSAGSLSESHMRMPQIMRHGEKR
jgi:hypothetical protein